MQICKVKFAAPSPIPLQLDVNLQSIVGSQSNYTTVICKSVKHYELATSPFALLLHANLQSVVGSQLTDSPITLLLHANLQCVVGIKDNYTTVTCKSAKPSLQPGHFHHCSMQICNVKFAASPITPLLYVNLQSIFDSHSYCTTITCKSAKYS